MDISVVVPIYNVEKYLRACLDSLINQDFLGSYEIICINDGSTDKSLKILKEYEKNHSIIKVISQENKGLSATRNIGIKSAAGKYIFFIDSDDYFTHANVLGKMFEEAETNQLDILVADFEFVYENQIKNYRIKRDECIKNKIMKGTDFYEIGRKKKSLRSIVVNKMYKRELLIKNNLFFIEGILHEDMEFTPRVYQFAERVKYIDEVIYAYRQREGSIMNKSRKNIRYINDYFKISDSLSKFNEMHRSRAIFEQELYIYLNILRKFKYLDDKSTQNLCISELKEREVIKKFLKSADIKYKLYGIYIFLKFNLQI